MAKLLDLLVAAEGYVPVAGRVYAQGGDGWVNPYDNAGCGKVYALPSVSVRGTDISDCGWFALADDYQTSIVTAEAILAARAVRP